MTLDALVEEIEDLLLPLSHVLDDIGVQVRAMYSVGFFGHTHAKEMAAQAEGVVRRALTHNSGMVAGAGFVWQHPDADESGMLWWRAEEGQIIPKVHIFNPHADAFYDYRQTEWYQQALADKGLAISGPFIDAWGTDDHALTPSRRIFSGVSQEHPLGVAAVDLQIHRVTERLLVALERVPGAAVVVNAEGHVVCASHPLLTPGIRLERFLNHREMEVLQETPLVVRGWRLLTLSAR